MIVNPAKAVRGEIPLPGDKSISHRSAIIAAMANGTTRIANFSASADCAATVSCLRQLGVEIRQDGTNLEVIGVGKDRFRKPLSELDCQNSGTTMRLLSGVLAGQNFRSVLIGDESLGKRPMKRVIEPLSRMGAAIEAEEEHAPMTIIGQNPLNAIEYELPIASAQIKSCVLLAGLNAYGETSVIEKTPTRDHTERMLRWFGAEVQQTSRDGSAVLSVSGDATLMARDLTVPGDISAAAFFIVAAAGLSSSEITLPNVGLNPTRTGIIDVLKDFGAGIEISDVHDSAGEPVGTLVVRSGIGRSISAAGNILRGSVIANVIDEIPILAVLGTQLENGLEVRDAAELRVKETDRIAAVVENLRRMNAEVEEFPDGFRVSRSKLNGAQVDSFGDHRITMAFAIAGLFADGPTEIAGADSVEVSFPNFFEGLNSVVE